MRKNYNLIVIENCIKRGEAIGLEIAVEDRFVFDKMFDQLTGNSIANSQHFQARHFPEFPKKSIAPKSFNELLRFASTIISVSDMENFPESSKLGFSIES